MFITITAKSFCVINVLIKMKTGQSFIAGEGIKVTRSINKSHKQVSKNNVLFT